MERRLSGKVMPTIEENSNSVNNFEAISKMNLTKEQKALLFILTQICYTTNKKRIIGRLERIKETGRLYPNTTSSELIQSCLSDLESSELSNLSQELIDILNKNDNEEVF